MKIAVKLPKLRNPLVAAKTRRAGAHETELSGRRARRTQKHQLYLLVSGRRKGDAGDL